MKFVKKEGWLFPPKETQTKKQKLIYCEFCHVNCEGYSGYYDKEHKHGNETPT